LCLDGPNTAGLLLIHYTAGASNWLNLAIGQTGAESDLGFPGISEENAIWCGYGNSDVPIKRLKLIEYHERMTWQQGARTCIRTMPLPFQMIKLSKSSL
jgi:hypothetical protein